MHRYHVIITLLLLIVTMLDKLLWKLLTLFWLFCVLVYSVFVIACISFVTAGPMNYVYFYRSNQKSSFGLSMSSVAKHLFAGDFMLLTAKIIKLNFVKHITPFIFFKIILDALPNTHD